MSGTKGSETVEYLRGVHSGNFDLVEYIGQAIPSDKVVSKDPGSAVVRRELTRYDPLLFGVIYCRSLITDKSGSITAADLHYDLCRYALQWCTPAQKSKSRTAFVAPRNAGKSTWLFKVIPLWAAAHGHAQFIAAFSSSGSQATTHLTGLRRQIESNQLLRHDFPELCRPAKRAGGRFDVSNTFEHYHSESGFTFAAKGIDSEVLGLVDPLNRRPDKIILDDIEPNESSYSLYQKGKRLSAVIDTVLPMNDQAHVALVGTVTMAGSIIHDLVDTTVSRRDPPQWVKDENFQVRYYPPIIKTDGGGERSIWPAKWPIKYLQSRRHTRSFKKNFENKPMRDDGAYWSPDTFVYGDIEHPVRTLLEIDPAVTSKTTSDETAFAIVAWDRDNRVCSVRYAKSFRLSPAGIRAKALELLEGYPEVGAVRIETNQGGDTWKEILHDLPVRLFVHHESVPKKVRARHLLTHYERSRVLHAEPLPELENQMCAFPDVVNDDLVDAVGAGVQYFLAPRKKPQRRSVSYR
jgi:phage terminase large subunit-like protein